MLLCFPFLPRGCVADILFTHGGLLALDSIFGNATCGFLRRAFHSNHPDWTDAICATIVVSKLRHAGDAIYLLIDEAPDIDESRRAWSVARQYDIPNSAPRLLRAMASLLPRCAFCVNEWLDRNDLLCARQPEEWVAFALECVEDCRFQAQPSPWLCAAQEAADLEQTLLAKERDRIAQVRNRPKISFLDEQAARAEADHQTQAHRRILAEVRCTLFDSISTEFFDLQYPAVARIILGLSDDYPAIRWSLRVLLYQASDFRLGYPDWLCERFLRRQAWKGGHPLQALRSCSKK